MKWKQTHMMRKMKPTKNKSGKKRRANFGFCCLQGTIYQLVLHWQNSMIAEIKSLLLYIVKQNIYNMY